MCRSSSVINGRGLLVNGRGLLIDGCGGLVLDSFSCVDVLARGSIVGNVIRLFSGAIVGSVGDGGLRGAFVVVDDRVRFSLSSSGSVATAADNDENKDKEEEGCGG